MHYKKFTRQWKHKINDAQLYMFMISPQLYWKGVLLVSVTHWVIALTGKIIYGVTDISQHTPYQGFSVTGYIMNT
jgi:hypothetical protein